MTGKFNNATRQNIIICMTKLQPTQEADNTNQIKPPEAGTAPLIEAGTIPATGIYTSFGPGLLHRSLFNLRIIYSARIPYFPPSF